MSTSLDLKNHEVSKTLLDAVPARIALHYCILPLERKNGMIRLVIPEDTGREAKDELRVVMGRDVEFLEGPRAEIEACITKNYGVGAGVIETLAGTEHEQSGSESEVIDQDKREAATITKLVNELILDAVNRRASDIHIEPFEKSLRIRYRVDGLLEEAQVLEKIRRLAPSIISRIKIMAKLDIGEKRLPQDGRIKIRHRGGEFDLRVSVLPSSFGEAIVIRILRPLEFLELSELGFESDALGVIRKNLKKPHGLILVTGPTGSGKTTTLYGCLKELNTVVRKTITVEDPIEYKLRGIIQMQVNTKIEFTFARALRSMLRHDPDCLMVGEIRDRETAEIAVRSALTGHLVLSTLHTNDAPSALTRLLEMGIEPYLVASSVELVMAQRLVRKACKPCDQCRGTGFYGRTVVYEIMPMSESLRDMILARQSGSILRRKAMEEGMTALAQNARQKAKRRLTTADEIERIVASE